MLVLLDEFKNSVSNPMAFDRLSPWHLIVYPHGIWLSIPMAFDRLSPWHLIVYPHGI